MDAVVEVHGLTKRYVSGPVVGPIDFEVWPGQVLAVAGSNGAGKSTTLRMLLGLASPSQGRALVMGRPYRQLEHPGLQVGVFLGGRLGDESMTSREYLTFMAGMQGLHNVRRRVRRVLRACSLDHWPKVRIRGYSTGMRQRLGVACAMLSDAPILVLDEPFNGLDIEGRLWLHDSLKQWAESGRTVILAAHEIEELQRIATHVLIVMHGRQMGCGPIEQVINDNSDGAGIIFRFANGVDVSRKAAALNDLMGMGADLRALKNDLYLARRTDEDTVFATAARCEAPLVQLNRAEPTLREVMTSIINRSSVKSHTS
ncbi:ABC transporter ATP-binding protein [Bifidobacterium amazonense]|uniref:ABC transporter n=3 Tax=Bifidobacterium TaxID=1678 RepID=A0A086ZXI9_9BIFI|nr:ABC transporter ATP-binding protein [Bifidobacterium biavatii]KFI51239.1 ABC transporter [Bifidobacterium biavatii DSM 23969]MBW3093205.1 ABC transporter ATP-binding protein [Bifidobacterium miconis]MCH9277119.1 ABC transporter ATP-binding protein [Bifidobacterium amazonense]MCH9277123.1 ABC transporter ATP-binding protein [Bifidobacterium amazonense]